LDATVVFQINIIKAPEEQDGSVTTDSVASGPHADAACILTRWQHFSARHDIVATILKV